MKITEEILHRIWDGEYLIGELETSDGREIEILYHGQRNPDTGPDFKDALIKIEGALTRGDVEVHTHASNWRAHNHHLDPRYNNVILHAVMWAEKKECEAIKENGQRVPTLILSRYLDESFLNLQQKLIAPISQHCPLSENEEEEIIKVVERWGEERLRLKAERFRGEKRGHSWDQLLYQGMMEALGYSKNQLPFLRLARRLPIETIFQAIQDKPEEEALEIAQALLFGAAGLLQVENLVEKETILYLYRLRDIWEKLNHRLQIQPLRANEWQFFRLRPLNFPTRRLGGVSYLMVRFAEGGIHKKIAGIIRGLAKNINFLISELERIFTCKATGYWETHYRFEEGERRKSFSQSPALIGRERAREIVLNVVLPIFLLYAWETEEGELRNLVKEVYRRYPKLADNKIIRTMTQRLFGEKRARLITNAHRQQGLIHMYKCFCPGGRCESCMQKFT